MRSWTVALFAAAMPVAAAASPFGDAPAVSDAELGEMRGGVLLPNGLDIAVGVSIETRVDGQLALRTQFTTDGGVQVFSGGAAEMRSQAAAGASARGAAPMVRIDRNGAGTTITPAATMPNVQIGVSRGSTIATSGGTPLPVVAGGDAVPTALGAVRIDETDRGTSVVLAGPTIELRHLVGQATGFVVANTADNRAIDTVANVNVDVRGASALLGTNALQIDRIAVDASSRNPF